MTNYYKKYLKYKKKYLQLKYGGEASKIIPLIRHILIDSFFSFKFNSPYGFKNAAELMYEHSTGYENLDEKNYISDLFELDNLENYIKFPNILKDMIKQIFDINMKIYLNKWAETQTKRTGEKVTRFTKWMEEKESIISKLQTILYNNNHLVRKRFNKYVQDIIKKIKNENENESLEWCVVWHGTNAKNLVGENEWGIIQNGLNLSNVEKDGSVAVFGNGIYFGDSSHTPLIYKEYKPEDNDWCLIGCLVLAGTQTPRKCNCWRTHKTPTTDLICPCNMRDPYTGVHITADFDLPGINILVPHVENCLPFIVLYLKDTEPQYLVTTEHGNLEEIREGTTEFISDKRKSLEINIEQLNILLEENQERLKKIKNAADKKIFIENLNTALARELKNYRRGEKR